MAQLYKEIMLAICVFTISPILHIEAKDFGKRGHYFEISEEGFLDMIHRKLKSLNIEKHNNIMQKLANEKIENPIPVSGILHTTQERNFIFDPTHTLKKDIKLPNGGILHRAGTKINPLDHMNFDRKLFFIDSSDKLQVEWVKKELGKSKKEERVILVKGNPLELSDELRINIYFDQFGELTKKFGIQQVPAILEQEGNVLKIKEQLI